MELAESSLISAVKNPSVWPDSPDEVDCIETHISWVLLTRKFAWKIRKPVHFGFLNFSTLELRRHFGQEELRLNRRTAAELYVDLVPICGTPEQPIVGGSMEPIEFAVKMHRFPQRMLLSELAASGKLNDQIIDQLAETIARFHQSIPAANDNSPFGQADDIFLDAMDNFATIEAVPAGDEQSQALLYRLKDWTLREFQQVRPVLEKRLRDGFVRDCHGDLHLRNIVQLETGPRPFDCLEFNERLRWSDVMSEIAFLIMDLEERCCEKPARRFLNRYLELTGDYAGLDVLRFYLVYRALVRAKVDVIQLKDSSGDVSLKSSLLNEFRGYVAVATEDALADRPAIVIMHGYSGSGKTSVSQQLIEESHTIRIRSDVERKRLYEERATDRLNPVSRQWLYSAEATAQTYSRLYSLADGIIRSGHSAVIDATFLNPQHRDRFRCLANNLKVPFRIVSCVAPRDCLESRVSARHASGSDASDADLRVLREQLASDNGILTDSSAELIVVHSDEKASVEAAVDQLAASVL